MMKQKKQPRWNQPKCLCTLFVPCDLDFRLLLCLTKWWAGFRKAKPVHVRPTRLLITSSICAWDEQWTGMISPCAWNACKQSHLSYPSNECKYDPTVANCLHIKQLGSGLRQASVCSGHMLPCMKSDSCLLVWEGDWDREVCAHMHAWGAACFWPNTWSCVLMLS